MILTRALSNKLMMSLPVRKGSAARSFTGFSRHLLVAATICATALLAASQDVWAATINYGDFNVPSAGIMFQQVRESSGTDAVPMYGPPTPYVIGLDFDPTAFVSSATGGANDITDGQLNFTIMGLSNPNGYIGISSFNLSEAGDYTLAGAGTQATSALAGAIVRATVTQINGQPVAPINLPPANASVGFNLVANPGIVQPWNLGIGYNLMGVLPQGQVATKVEVVVNNSLLTFSEPGSIAFIAKKDFRIDLTPTPPVGDPFVPEPASLVLSCFACVLAAAVRKARS